LLLCRRLNSIPFSGGAWQQKLWLLKTKIEKDKKEGILRISCPVNRTRLAKHHSVKIRHLRLLQKKILPPPKTPPINCMWSK
jgi:hypothetical protein